MMLTSQGPSSYGRSPPAGFLPDCGPLWFAPATAKPAQPPPMLTRRSAPAFFTAVRLSPLCNKAKPPSRSCLQQNGPAREKKKVVFADDRGLSLTHVRVMAEPSHMPPFWTTLSDSPPPRHKTQTDNKWEMCFVQPASEYVSFRKRILEKNVALENVIVKEAQGFLTGTVKVRNLHFSKEVVIRSTADEWRTSEDTTCAYSSTTCEFDTFFFKVQLPTHSKRLEFCVCFRCQGEEFWDSNGGTNYILEKPSPDVKVESFFGRVKTGNAAQNGWSGDAPYW